MVTQLHNDTIEYMPKGYTTPREIECHGCEVAFLATGSRSKYCSRKCLDAKRWRDKHPEIRHTRNNKYGVSQKKLDACLICEGNMNTAFNINVCSQKCNMRIWTLKSKYRITPDDFKRLMVEQNFVCAICKTNRHSRDLHVDHDHACCSGERSCGKCVRGLLCKSCNWGLGNFCDSLEMLTEAMEYLKRYAFHSKLVVDTTIR